MRRLLLCPLGACLVPAHCCAVRRLRPTAVIGIIEPHEGFVSTDIRIDINVPIGGLHARAVYARREMGFGREIINVPAFAMYVGDEPTREQVLRITEEILRKLATNHPHKKWIFDRVMSMMYGGPGFFFRERDCVEFAESVKIDAVQHCGDYLHGGEFTSNDLQRLPQLINFNRWEVEYNGRRGVCLFPEASYFSHDCDPNVELTVEYSTTRNTFVLSGRLCKPVKPGEQLYIHYMPGNNLPLSRFALQMKKRWGFECTCHKCRGRVSQIIGMCIVFFMVPAFFATKWYNDGRARNRTSMV